MSTPAIPSFEPVALAPPVREEYERIPEPLQDVAVEAPLPIGKRLSNQTWLRKAVTARSRI